MRVVVCLALLTSAAAPALAQDRYGPEPSALRASAPTSMTGQRLLTWANKVEPAPAPEAAPPQSPADQPQRVASTSSPPVAAQPPVENAPWRRLTGAPYTPQAAPQAVPRLMAAVQPAPAPAPQAMASNTLPARPTTPVSAGRPLTPVLAGGPPVNAGTAAPTKAAAANAAPATPDYRTEVAAAPAAPAQGEQARYYSLHREYGETPDPIPMPEKTQVFLAAVPLSSLDQPDNQDADTGQTAAQNKARLAADWGAADDPSTTTSRRVQVTRP